MPTKWETFPIKFEGGWRTDLGRLEQGIQAPGSAITLKNFEPAVNGGYTKILGYSKYSSTDVAAAQAEPVIGVIVLSETDALARKGTRYCTSSGTTWTEKLTVVTPNATRIHFDMYNFDGTDKWVVVDGFNDPAIYNTLAGTMAFETGAPADVVGAHLVRVFKNHIFYAKGNLLSFTAPYTDNDYTPGNGAGVINIGGDITGLIAFRDQLIIFTVDSIHRLAGNTLGDFQLQPITTSTGCLDPYTVQEVGGDILYLGPDGVRWLSATERNEDFGLERASENIQSEVSRTIVLGPQYTSLPIRAKNQYRLFTYSTSTPKALSRGFLATKYSDQGTTRIEWGEIVGMKVYSAHSRQFDDREIVLFTSEDEYVYKMENTGGFDGGDISYSFKTPWMPITDPRIRKTIYKHSLYLKTTGTFSIDFNLKLDYNPSGSIQPYTINMSSTTGVAIYGVAVYGTDSYSQSVSDTFVNQTVGSGFVFSLEYSGSDTNPPFNLDFAILEYGTNERR